MKIIGLDEFKKDIGILRYLQRKVISILSSEDDIISGKVDKLFGFLKSISISHNFGLYEGFLRILTHISIYFGVSQKAERKKRNQTIFFNILNELISQHSLKNAFHQTTLAFIFRKNKHFLLFLVQNGILDISFIIKEIASDKNFFLFFIPEIVEHSPQLFLKKMKDFKLTKDEIVKIYDKLNISIQDDLENEKLGEDEKETMNKNNSSQENNHVNQNEIRKEIHSQEEIAQIIRDDNLDLFIENISSNVDFDINSKILPSFLENNPDINHGQNGITVLEYSMAFGSMNIFRYLWVNKAEYSKQSLNYSIIGGNSEIIHTLEEKLNPDQDEQFYSSLFGTPNKSKFQFDEENYYKSIEYYQNEISEYFRNTIKMEPLEILNRLSFPEHIRQHKYAKFLFNGNQPEIIENISIFAQTSNFELFSEILDTESPFKKFLNTKIFSLLIPYIYEIITMYNMNNSSVTFYLLYQFICQQPGFDVNSKRHHILFYYSQLFFVHKRNIIFI
ncbi:hypothetical protein TRFO_23451 [Tritrichomonas foetus]|uniref:DUF3447 domain-containing protein n=1 Tax=Tritrichomonas foetus TaxID=1144522 RepID=A0A1J4KEJ6_9EUKA|nr:hypothetical protein TRFO_23451 [Tritrichomonas foetus]|eukprot:OHT08164.1 hypothetical protein TRFO_23451 [Tritrichomonas foetus]